MKYLPLHPILSFAIFVLIFGMIYSCNNPLVPSDQISPLFSKEPTMTTVAYPSLKLTANGSTALLDNAKGGFKIYSVPGLQPQFGEVPYVDLVKVILSSSGTAVGAQTADNELRLLSSAHHPTYPIPRKREAIHSLTISDAGDKLAILTAESPEVNSLNKDNGVLEIWSLPVSNSPQNSANRPLASIRLPLLDSSVVIANGEFSTFSVRSANTLGNHQFIGLYHRDLATGELKNLWKEEGNSLKRLNIALYKDWTWAVQTHEIAGWYQDNSPVELPATLREHLIYSPTGSHLLAYRGEETINVTSQKMLFRLFDLASIQEIKRATHIVHNYNNANFALTKDLVLLELHATKDSKIAIEELKWSNP